MFVLAYNAREVSRHVTLKEAEACVLCYGDNIYDAAQFDAMVTPFFPVKRGSEVLRRRYR